MWSRRSSRLSLPVTEIMFIEVTAHLDVAAIASQLEPYSTVSFPSRLSSTTRFRMFRSAILIALAAALAGCAHVPDLGARPEPKPASAYAAQQAFQAPARQWPADRWWTNYGDPQLDRLMEEALADSPSLAQAEARVRKADAVAEVAGGARKPKVDLNATVATI